MSAYFDTSLLGIPAFSFICAGVGSYVGGYLKKRGENLATKEDFDDLKAQTAALTQATKEIEARISGDLWSKQRNWELKRDVLFETAEKIGASMRGIMGLYGIYSSFPDREQLTQKAIAHTKYADAMGDLYAVSVAVGLVCTEGTKDALRDLHIYLGDLGQKIPRRAEVFNESSITLVEKLHDVTIEIRREIEGDKPR